MKFATYTGNSIAATRMQTLPDFKSTYIPKCPVQVEFCVRRNSVTYGEVYKQRSAADVLPPTQWNLIGRSLTAPSHVLSSSSSFRHNHVTGCPFQHEKIRRAFQKRLFHFCFILIAQVRNSVN